MEKDYEGSVKIQDFSSNGRVSRILGRKTGRIHHFLSDLETKVFYILDFDKNVVDIKEHYPLEDVRDLITDNDINWKKFNDKKTDKEYAITTTFLVTLSNNKEVAISCKNKSQLYKSSTQLKLEIERRYWNIKGINWCIVTNEDISNIKLNNIKWLQLGESLIDINAELLNIIEETISINTGKLKNYIENISKKYNYEYRLVLSTIKTMIINNYLLINLDEEISLETNIERFLINEEMQWKS
jgi:TnsA endonuclease N terminal.